LSAVDTVLAHARFLHRAACSDSLSSGMPVLRRLQRAGIHAELPLPGLWARRDAVQRKHVLRMLAREMGFADWERCKAHLARSSPQAVDHLKLGFEWTGRFNHWFAGEAAAVEHMERHGGRLMRWGDHSVVVSTAEGRP
jgi:hypothetical protein